MSFKVAGEMLYANDEGTKSKAKSLLEKLSEYLKSVKKDKNLFFEKGETVYIPDCHGDFIHLIITLHRHGLLNANLDLKKENSCIFLGDFYDRAPLSDVIDFWLNNQIKRDLKIYRLIGNHEYAFLERDENDYPVIFPSQDSIKDIENNFQITESLLRNIANGNLLATYVQNPLSTHTSTLSTLYIHSYAINNDFIELGLKPDTDIFNFAITLNERLKKHGQYAYDVFLDCKKRQRYDWKEITKSFQEDNLFNIHKTKNDISTSFMWRRTGVPTLNMFPVEIDVEIPENVYQIVGHTPVFYFDLPRNHPINVPFVISSKKGTGKIQFSDVGIGYHYKNDFERPEVIINKRLAVQI